VTVRGKPLPTIGELQPLAVDLKQTAHELNGGRRLNDGFW
jgi:hypothetical protein